MKKKPYLTDPEKNKWPDDKPLPCGCLVEYQQGPLEGGTRVNEGEGQKALDGRCTARYHDSYRFLMGV